MTWRPFEQCRENVEAAKRVDPEQRNDRVRIARERAGLSVGQAARLLGVTQTYYERIEDPSRDIVEFAPVLADLFGVNVEWLCGHVPLRDYKTIKEMNGADSLSFQDLDELALFAASMPRRSAR